MLTDTRGMLLLDNLEELLLPDNHIRTIVNLETLTNLTKLDLRNNELSSLQGLRVLAMNPHLTELYLEGNELLVNSQSRYWLQVMNMVGPQLRSVDGHAALCQ